MKIHLSKPGGQMEGPFTVEQINRDLAAKKYQDTDYWAWYEGQGEWVPLHSVPGVLAGTQSLEVPGGGTKVEQRAAGDAVGLNPNTAAQAVSAAPTAAGQAREKTPPSFQQQLSSGMPFAALEQIFILTTEDGQAASHSAVTGGMLESVTGEELSAIRQSVPRHVISSCNFLEKLRGGGAFPDVAWRAVANLNPELVYQARQGKFRVCVRTFPIETGEMVTLLLFYNKQKL